MQVLDIFAHDLHGKAADGDAVGLSTHSGS
jgi:hypothetical protein